jgi:hypothetical protein
MFRPASVVGCLLALACTRVDVDLSDRSCYHGQCASGWDCHPETNVCVVPVDVGCGGIAICPSAVVTGTPCASSGSFLPCEERFSDCSAGCRTCRDDLTWSDCSAPLCVVGEPWSCSGCGDDCRNRVLYAHAICAAGTCSYDGTCASGTADADGDRANGCECQRNNGGIERCDHEDNNCDGDIDEGFAVDATCGAGICTGGVRECAANGTAVCSTMPGGSGDLSVPETCNGEDDDCNGIEDDVVCVPGTERPCDAGGGAGSGSQVCTNELCDWDVCQTNWWDEAWAHRARLDIDTSFATSDLLDVPLLVQLDAAHLDLYDELLPSGADLRFVDVDGSRLAHEIEQWNAAGTSFVWVRLPRLRGAPAEQYITLYFGNPSAIPDSNGTAVWDDSFSGVWHLGDGAVGVGGIGNYQDSTARYAHGDDRVASSGKAGTIGAGQSFAAGDAVMIPDGGALGITTALTVEAWINPAQGWRWQRLLSFTQPTVRPGFQYFVTLTPGTFDYSKAAAAGADLRFYQRDGTAVPHYVQAWDPGGTSTIWLRIPSPGTNAVRMFYGNPSAANTSSASAVFDFYDNFVLLDSGRWQVNTTTATVLNDVLTIPSGSIGLVDPLPFDLAEGYTVEAAVRFDEGGAFYSGVAPAICSARFGSPNNSNSDAVVLTMRSPSSTDVRVWAGTGVNSTYDAESLTPTAWLSSNINWYLAAISVVSSGFQVWSAGSIAYTSRALVWRKPLTYIVLGAYNGNQGLDIASTSYDWVRVRKYSSLGQTAPGLGVETPAGLGEPGRFSMGAEPGTFRASVGSSLLFAASTSGWRYVALTADAEAAILYLDGTAVDADTEVAAIGPALADFLLGDFGAFTGGLDEARLSRVARSPTWLRVQHASMTDALITFSASEPRP